MQRFYIQMFTSDFYLQLILTKSITCQLYLQHGQGCVQNILADHYMFCGGKEAGR